MKSLVPIFVLGLGLATASTALGEDLYVSQSGTGSGTSCSSPRSVSWFQTSGNWANPKQAGKIGPGDTVHLCGTITDGLTLQGSGASGTPVVIDGSGATLGTAVGFNNNSKSWWRAQNMRWADGAGLPLRLVGGSNGVFTGCRADQTHGFGFISGSPDNITISNCYVRSTNANLGNDQHDMIAADSGTNIIIEGNHIELRIDGYGSSAHNDVIQTWGAPSNWTVRYNWIALGCTEPHDRSWMMLESLSGTFNIYGNVFYGTNGCGVIGNGIASQINNSGYVLNIYENTFVAKNGPGNILNLSSPGTANIRGNVFHIDNNTGITGNMTKNRSYNLWFGGSIPSCSGVTGEICGLDPLFASYATNNFSLSASSPAKDMNTTFGSPFNFGVAPGSTWPGPTIVQRSGYWDRGAFQEGGSATPPPSAPPSAPTNVRVIR